MNNTKFEKLLEPGYIGKVRTRNRMIKTANGTSFIETSGYVGDRALARRVVHPTGDFAMNFWIFLAGCVIVIGGVAWGLSVSGVSTCPVPPR